MANTQAGVGSVAYGLELMQPLNENAPFITWRTGDANRDVLNLTERGHSRSEAQGVEACGGGVFDT